ncbi:unnamed protein product [Amoebophrya sp. A120]|nr:unnamed protein product [Amoebophrya sp. A120]|eukprot:GSA120T00009098001.1
MASSSSGSSAIRVRRADAVHDQDALLALREEVATGKSLSTTTLQSSKELLYVLDTQFLSLVVLEDEKIVAYVALEACPGVNAYKVRDMVSADLWLSRVKPTEKHQNYSLGNSLWLNDHINLTTEYVKQVCTFVFSQPRMCVEYLFAVERKSQAAHLFSEDGNYFTPVPSADQVATWVNRAYRSADCVKVLTTEKKKYIQPLKIRMAKGEDHDSLVAVFNQQSEVVTEVYGDFFLAELMEAQNEENKAIVAESDETGRAVGLCCLTCDVDANVLAQCFELLPYDNLLKRKYWSKVKAQMEKERAAAGEDESFCRGDYLQAALQGMELEMFVSNLILLQTEDHEEPEGVTAMQLLNALRTQEYGDKYTRADIDIAESIMIGIWHQMWWTPRIEANTFLRFEELHRLARRMKKYDIGARRAIAQNILDKWDKMYETFWVVKEAADQSESEKRDLESIDKKKRAKEGDGDVSPMQGSNDLDSYDINVPRAERGIVPRVTFGKLLYHLTTSLEDAQKDQRRASIMKKGSKDSKKKNQDYQELLDPKNIENMDEKTPPLLTREEATDLLFVVHWWSTENEGINCISAIDQVDSESLKNCLEAIVKKEDDIFINHHQSSSWLFGVPDVMKDFFCVNLFCVDEAIAHRSADFLLPAFALFPDKDYCVITQPHTSKITPFLQAFSMVPPKPSNTFGHVLFVLHRACCTASLTPTVRMLEGEADLDRVAAVLDGMDLKDGEFIANTVEAALLDDDAQTFVVEFDNQVIGVVGSSLVKDDYLETLRCVYQVDRAVNSPEYNSFAFVDFFLVNPIFDIFRRKILHLCQLIAGNTVFLYEAQLTTQITDDPIEDHAGSVHSGSPHTEGKGSPFEEGSLSRQMSSAAPFAPELPTGMSKKELIALKKKQEAEAAEAAKAAKKELDSLERKGYKQLVDKDGNLLPLSTIVKEMTPIPPRNSPSLMVTHHGGQSPSSPSAKAKPHSFASLPVEPQQQQVDAEKREKMRKLAEKNGLSLLARPRLSAPKRDVNARIVVVGASHTGLSFLLSLLLPNYQHLQFNSLTLVAPELNPISGVSLSPSLRPLNEIDPVLLRRLKADVRVKVLRDRVREIDRAQRALVLEGDKASLLPYDFLVLTPGLQDCTLSADQIQLRSYGFNKSAVWQIETADIKAKALQRKKEEAQKEKEAEEQAKLAENKKPRSAAARRSSNQSQAEEMQLANQKAAEEKAREEEAMLEATRPIFDPETEPATLNGVLSVGDPRLGDFFAESGTFVKALIWNPLTQICVYGNSLEVYTVIQGLLVRKVPASKILLVQPTQTEASSSSSSSSSSSQQQLPPPEILEKIEQQLEKKKIRICKNHTLKRLEKDGRDRLSSIVFTNEANHEEVAFSCRILLTADKLDVDPDIFHALHSNGLVFDGALIVDHAFQTTDSRIFAAGPLAEFSRSAQSSYVHDRQLLRHDGYNGMELGQHLAEAILSKAEIYDAEEEAAAASKDFTYQTLQMPIYRAGLLPGNLRYYCVRCPKNVLQARKEKQVKHMLTDTLSLDSESGHFCKITCTGSTVTEFLYLGYQELHRHALFHLVGRNISFLNGLEQRYASADGANSFDLVEFLTDSWTHAFYHDDFYEVFVTQAKKENWDEKKMKDKLLDYLTKCADLQKISSYYIPGKTDVGMSLGTVGTLDN